MLLALIMLAPFDATFEKYAPCAGVDGRLLSLIAQRESELDAARISKDGYVGLFQTRPEHCRAWLKGYALQARCDHLTEPEVNVAVGALMAHAGRELAEKTCARAKLRDQLAIVFMHHNVGSGAAAKAVRVGCDFDALLRGLGGGKGARKRLGHAYAIADAAIAAGVTALHPETDAQCPLQKIQ